MLRTYRARLFALLLTLLLVVVMLLSFAYLNTKEVLLQQAENNVEQNMRLFELNLLTEWRELQRFSTIISDNLELQEYMFVINNFDSGYEALPILYEKQFGWLPKDRTLIISNKNKLLYGENHQKLAKHFIAMNTGIDEFDTFFYNGDKGVELVSSHPVHYKDQILGKIVLTRYINENWFSKKQQSQSEHIIIEKKGVILFSSLNELISENVNLGKGHLLINKHMHRFFPINIPVTNSNDIRVWYGVNISKTTDLLEYYANKVFMVIAGGIIFIIMMGWAVSRNFDRPLSELTKLTRVIAEGKRPYVKKGEARTEIDILRNQFSDMVQAVKNKEQMLDQHRNNLEELVQQRTSELEVTRDRALDASKAKSQFLANMSHELRTPLNVIMGYSELVQESMSETEVEEYGSDLEKIYQSGHHLLGVINDVLDLSLIESGKLTINIEPFLLKDILYSVADSVEIMAKKKNNKIQVDYDSQLNQIISDPQKVRQALYNLLSNACKFTESGVVKLAAKYERRNNTDWVLISVADTGIGIDKDKIQSLFNPFTQADMSITKLYGGTGLGLTITKQFCVSLGGDVVVESEPGKGSVFTLQLPMDSALPDQKQTAIA